MLITKGHLIRRFGQASFLSLGSGGGADVKIALTRLGIENPEAHIARSRKVNSCITEKAYI